MVQELRRRATTTAVTSTTGLSSLNYRDLGGTTIHHWSGIRDGRYDAKELVVMLQEDEAFRQAAQRIKEVQCLIIDEIGMLSQRTFEQIEYICRKIRSSDQPFGGIQLVGSGCFKQLQPVPNVRVDDFGIHCFESALFEAVFPHHVNLVHVYRQTDEILISTIHELCEGNPSPDTHAFLRTLKRPLAEDRPSDKVYLYGSNFDVNFHNTTELHSHNPDLVPTEFRAVDTGVVSLLRKCAAPKVLALKPGCPIILVATVSGTLVNGMRGTVQSISAQGPTVDFGKHVVQLEKHQFTMYDRNIKGIIACREQIPIKLAYALTVHRAQGQTIQNLVVDCFSFFTAGQLGVAIGRAVDRDGLRVLNYNPEAAQLKHKRSVYEFYMHPSTAPIEDLSCCKGIVEEDLFEVESDVELQNVQPPTSHTDSTNNDIDNEVDDVHKCPWNVQQFLESCFNLEITETERQKDISATLKSIMTKDVLHRFIDEAYTYVHKLYNDNIGKTPKDKEVTKSYQQIHKSCTGNTSLRKSWTGVLDGDHLQTSGVTNHIFAQIIWATCKKYCHDQAETVLKVQRDKLLQGTDEEIEISTPILAKIRYIAGACISKAIKHIRTRIEHIQSSKGQKIRNLLYQQQQVLQVLRLSESNAFESAKDQATLEEITYRQNASHGLFHVSDNVLDFFVYLYRKAQNVQSTGHLHLDLENIEAVSTAKLLEDEHLLDKWFGLFTEQITSSLDMDEDLLESMMIDNFTAVVRHFSRVHLSEVLHKLKETLPRKKKQALRPGLQSKTAKSKTSAGSSGQSSSRPRPSETRKNKSRRPKRKANDDSTDSQCSDCEGETVTRTSYSRKSKSAAAASFQEMEDIHTEEPSSNAFPCGVCQIECADEPDKEEDESICCDKCELWFHYKCVNLTGSERFLSSKRAKWHCPSCVPQPQGKGKGKGRGKGKK